MRLISLIGTHVHGLVEVKMELILSRHEYDPHIQLTDPLIKDRKMKLIPNSSEIHMFNILYRSYMERS